MLEAMHGYVGRVRPTTFLLIYIAFIALFALIYCVLPGQQFYAQYAKMEPPAQADAQNVADNVRTSIATSYRNHQSMAQDWQIAGGDVGVAGIDISDARELSFTVAFFATLTQQGQERGSTGGPQFKAIVDPLRMVTVDRGKRLTCHLITLPADRSIAGFPEFNRHMLFRSPEGAIQADVLCWGNAQEDALQRLIDGWKGDPNKLSGSFWRMAYFSAMTITTVGYGDIIPLTTMARIFSAVEAITGWVLAGLFLNALAVKIAGNADKKV